MNYKKKSLSNEKLLKQLIVYSDSSIQETILKMNSNAMQVAIVLNKFNKYLGIITDGDIRRGLIKKISISQKIKKILNKKSITIQKNISRKESEEIMKRKNIEHLPIINKKKEFIGLHYKEGSILKDRMENPIIIMAGGKGLRLRPLTKNTPKPMIKINNVPILEQIILKLKKEKFYNFFISVNYLKNKIIDYFRDGKDFNVKITYLEEEQPLGTIGSLSLFKFNNNLPIIVCNGDVLSKVSAESILNFHNKKKSFATMGVIEYSHKNPFGVIKTKNFNFLKIREKPIKKYFINAGIYVFDSKIVNFLKENKKIDIPKLFSILKKQKKKVLIFPIHEHWRDIGNINDLKENENII